MSLLIDDIRIGKLPVVPPNMHGDPAGLMNWRLIMQDLQPHLNSAEIFQIDNVARYYYETQCRETWDMYKDFPNLAPPFPAFWMEYRPPKFMLELEDPNSNDITGPKVLRSTANVNLGRTGILCIGSDFEETRMNPSFPMPMKELVTYVFVERPGEECVVGGNGVFSFKLDEMGSVMRFTPGWYSGQGDSQRRDGMTLMAIPAWLSICFLHCKNVAVQTTTPHSKLNKYYKRRHNRSMSVYKTLEIEPMRKVLSHQGSAASDGIAKAMHICRGHFKDYRKVGLGKNHVKGMWWWDSHVRGSAEAGSVEKVYSVDVPK
jgi:hypothetical protein